MPNASVNIGGDASGAVAAVAAAQGAIDSLTGKTVMVDVEVRHGGAGGGVSGLARDMDKVATSAGRAHTATKGMADHVERAGRSGAGMGGGFERAGAGAERAGRAARGMGEDVARAGVATAALAGHTERVSGGMRAIEASGARGMNAIASGASDAGRGMRELESGASRAGVAVRNVMPSGGSGVGGGAIKSAIIDMERLSDGTYGVAEAMKAIGSRDLRHGGANDPWSTREATASPSTKASAGPGNAGLGIGPGETTPIGPYSPRGRGSGGASPPGGVGGIPRGGFSWAGVGPGDFEYTSGGRPADRSGRPRDAAEGRRSPAADRLAAARAARSEAAGIDEVGKSSERATGSAKGLGSELLKGMSPHHIERMISPLQQAGWQMAMVGGMMAGVTKEANTLMTATTGMGLNFTGMAAGIQRAEQSAARSHNLGLSGLDQELRQSARAMTNELAPAMKAGVGATKAFEEAKMGAQASLGPSIEGFANQMTRSAPQLQGIMSSLGKTALSLGTDVVAGLAQTGPAWASAADAVARNAPQLTQASKDFGNIVAGTIGTAASVVGFGEDMGNTFQSNLDRQLGARRDPSTGHLSSIGHQGDYDYWGSGAPKPGTPAAGAVGAGGAPVAPGAFDPSKPFSGTAILPGGEKTGTGDIGAAPSGAARRPSHDSDWAKGMTGKQIYEAEYQRATGGYPSTGPMPSGLGSSGAGPHPMSEIGAKAPAWPGPPPGTFSSEPGDLAHQPPASRGTGAGFGSGVRPIPPAAASGLGVADMTQSFAQIPQAAQTAMAGAQRAVQQFPMQQSVQQQTAGMARHIQDAAPQMESGGAALGASFGSGMAAGSTKSEQVTDTVIRKHVKRVVDAGMDEADAQSPSRKFARLGGWMGQGLALGIAGSTSTPVTAARQMVAQTNAAAQQAAQAGRGAMGAGGLGTGGVGPASPGGLGASSVGGGANRIAASGVWDNHNSPRLDPQSPQAQQQAADQQQAQRQQDPNQPSRVGQLGATPNSRDAIQQRWDAHEDRRQHLLADRAQRHDDAIAGAQRGISPAQAAAEREAQQAGQRIPAAIGKGVEQNSGAATDPMRYLSGMQQKQLKKDNDLGSPSRVYAGFGLNLVQGLGVGVAAGVPGAVSAMSGATAQMSAAVAGPLNNQGLMLGYSFATNIVDGATRVLKNANFQPGGTPTIANQQAQAALGRIDLLGPGAGTSVYKTPSRAMDGAAQAAQVATAIRAAIQSVPLSVTVNLDGRYVDHKIASSQDGLVEVLRDALIGANG